MQLTPATTFPSARLQMTAPYQVPQLPWLQELSLTAIKAIHQLQYSQRVIESQLQSGDTAVQLQPLQLPSFPYTECDKIYFILDQALTCSSAIHPNDVLHLLLHGLPYLATISTYLSAHQTWPLFTCSKHYVSVMHHIYRQLHALYLSELEGTDTTQKQVVRISYRWIVQLWLSLMQTTDVAEVHFEKLQLLGVDQLHTLIQSRAATIFTKTLTSGSTVVPAALAPVTEVIARIRAVAESVQHSADGSDNEKENFDDNSALNTYKRRRLAITPVDDSLTHRHADSPTDALNGCSIAKILQLSHLLCLPAKPSAANLQLADAFMTVACTSAEQCSNITPLLHHIVELMVMNNQQLWQQMSVNTQLRVFSTFPAVYMTRMVDVVATFVGQSLGAGNARVVTAFEPLLHLQHHAANKQERAVGAKYTTSLLRGSLDILSVLLVETSNAELLHIHQWINSQIQEQHWSATHSSPSADSQFADAASLQVSAANAPALTTALAAGMTQLEKLAGTAQRLNCLRRTIWLPLAANHQWVAYSAVKFTSEAQAQDTERVLWATALLAFIAPDIMAHTSSQQADSHTDRCLQLMLAVRASLASNPSITAFIQLVEPHTRLLPVAIIRVILCYLLPALPTSPTQGAFGPALVDWMLTSMTAASTGTDASLEAKTATATTPTVHGEADAISSCGMFTLLMRVTEDWLDCVSAVRSELPLAYRQQGGRGYAFALRQLHTSVSGEQGQRLRRTMDKLKEIGTA